jgi:hypothetical protein
MFLERPRGSQNPTGGSTPTSSSKSDIFSELVDRLAFRGAGTKAATVSSCVHTWVLQSVWAFGFVMNGEK